MSSEAAPAQPTGGIFYEDGSINETFLVENYGLGVEEASQEVQFGSYKGTVAHMLADEACPMGEKVQEAYREDGIEGVSKVFDGISLLDNNFKVEISAKTLERERPPVVDPPEDRGSDKLPPQAPEKKPAVSQPVETAQPTQTDLPAARKLPIPNEAEVVREVVRRENESEEAEPTEDTEEMAAAPLERAVDEVEIHSHEHQPALVDAVVIESEQQTLVDVVVAEPKVAETLIVKRESPVNIVGDPASKRIEVAAVAVTDETPLVSEKKVELQSVVMEEEVPDPVDATALAAITVETVVPVAEAPVLREKKAVLPMDELLADIRYIMQAEDTSEEIISGLGLPEQVVLPETTELIREMSEALESLEPAEAQNIQVAAVQMTEAVEQILALREAGQDSTDAEKVLLSACERLISELGINYSEESVEQLARLIIVAHEARLEFVERPELEPLPDEGTHEFKLGYLSAPMLAYRAKQKFVPLRALGKRALAGILAPA